MNPCQITGGSCENGPHLAHGEENIKEGGEREFAVVCAAAAFEAGAVVAHIDVGQGLDELHQARHHSVEPVCAHLLAHEVCQ